MSADATGRPRAGGLAEAARAADDPCDVACAAMPARVLGELDRDDAAWLRQHAAGCAFCARESRAFESVCIALDEVMDEHAAAPPPLRLPNAAPPAWLTEVESPLGPLRLAVSAAGLCEIAFAASDSAEQTWRELEARGYAPAALDAAPSAARVTLQQAARELAEYFAGDRRRFDVPLDLSGVTPFTRSVLAATEEVGFGRLDTYRGIAVRIGKPGAVRAVGNALGRNPLPVIVPCHRIVRTDASLGGYTGGLGIKQHLLALEGATLPS
ncbi:MAG: methylated-DNA--[protein]-cysteine S-methyltransferase [Thermomicrobiales bacterium]|nr:methylated-DNA--[protein]-cysteine S-methyltransferase [Thermomicrobiales bacterium]